MANVDLAGVVAELQTAERKLEEAIASIEKHNIDQAAHQDIREAIEELKQTSLKVTPQYVEKVIEAAITDLKSTNFKEVFKGWEAFENALNERLDTVQHKLSVVEQKVDGTYIDPTTDLRRELQAIEEKYAPILANLQEAFQQAQDRGQTEVAEQTKQSIKNLLDQKSVEMLAVMTKYQQATGGGDESGEYGESGEQPESGESGESGDDEPDVDPVESGEPVPDPESGEPVIPVESGDNIESI